MSAQVRVSPRTVPENSEASFFFFFFFVYPHYRAKMCYLCYTLTGCGILDRALMRSVTVLILLGLWLSAVWAMGCCNESGVYGNSYSR